MLTVQDNVIKTVQKNVQIVLTGTAMLKPGIAFMDVSRDFMARNVKIIVVQIA